MRRVCFVMMSVAGILGLIVSGASAQEPLEGREVLEKLVGTWDVEMTVKTAFGSERVAKVVETRKWSEGGQMLHCSIPRTSEAGQPEYHLMVRYDQYRKNYPGILFTENDRALIEATWDIEKQTLRFQGKLGDGSQFEFTYRFVDDNTIESVGTVKDSSGQVFIDRKDRQVRKQ